MHLLQNLDADVEAMERDKITLDIEFDSEYKEALGRFVKFSCLVYVPYFMVSSIGSDGPFNDLELHKLLLEYKNIDEDRATIALAAMNNLFVCACNGNDVWH